MLRDAALRRRDFLRSTALAAGAVSLGPGLWREALAAPARAGEGPYGPLQAADANGVMLPRGFRSRIIARGQQPVENTTYVWHASADGMATYATPDGGFILVSNSELPAPGTGGAAAIRFDRDFRIVNAYRILSGTMGNCAGGPTPWGTWMSCEEHDRGLVWECDPTGSRSQGEARPAMGVFSHEAAAVDPLGQRIYLTEDEGDSGFYRFTPTTYPDARSGLLEIATVADSGRVAWTAVPDPSARTVPTRRQVPGSTRFRRGEGIWYDGGLVYVVTTSDGTVRAYDPRTETIDVVYAEGAIPDPPLTDIDNITVSPSGDIFTSEDDGAPDSIDVGLITPDGVVSRFLKLVGPLHTESEATGPIFDPSGKRFYISSQRAFGGPGVIFEITGPFRLERPPGAPGAPTGPLGGGSPGPLPSPALGLELPRRIPLATSRRTGIPLAITLDAPATVEATLFARFTPAGRRRSSGRRGRRLLRLASARRELPAGGPVIIPLELSSERRRDLRGRRQSLRAVARIVLTDASGRQRAINRTVVIRGPRFD